MQILLSSLESLQPKGNINRKVQMGKPRVAMKENLTVAFKTKNPLTPSEVKRAAVGLGIDQLGQEGDG